VNRFSLQNHVIDVARLQSKAFIDRRVSPVKTGSAKSICEMPHSISS